MKQLSKYTGLIVSTILFILVVPYSLIEWFDDSIPFSPILYLFSIVSIVLLAYNIYSFRKKD